MNSTQSAGTSKLKDHILLSLGEKRSQICLKEEVLRYIHAKRGTGTTKGPCGLSEAALLL